MYRFPLFNINSVIGNISFKKCFYTGIVDSNIVLKVDCSSSFEIQKEIVRVSYENNYLFLHDVNNNLSVIDKNLYSCEDLENIFINYYKYTSNSTNDIDFISKYSPLKLQCDTLFLNNIFLFVGTSVSEEKYNVIFNLLQTVINENLFMCDMTWKIIKVNSEENKMEMSMEF
jgi:hypothetical protein